MQKLSGAIETGQYAFSCFYDLSKAFDRVWHAGLLCKLEHLGVRGKALDWLKDYLTIREQQVRVNGTPLVSPENSCRSPPRLSPWPTPLPDIHQ